MKVFLENFSKADTAKLLEAIKDAKLVDKKEESDFWFNEKIAVDEAIKVIKEGDIVMPCDDDIAQRKA